MAHTVLTVSLVPSTHARQLTTPVTQAPRQSCVLMCTDLCTHKYFFKKISQPIKCFKRVLKSQGLEERSSGPASSS